MEKQTVKKEVEVFEVKCPKCGKVITSMYEDQFNYNIKQHADSHARKEEKAEK